MADTTNSRAGARVFEIASLEWSASRRCGLPGKEQAARRRFPLSLSGQSSRQGQRAGVRVYFLMILQTSYAASPKQCHSPNYFFWSGRSKRKSEVSNWQKIFAKGAVERQARDTRSSSSNAAGSRSPPICICCATRLPLNIYWLGCHWKRSRALLAIPVCCNSATLCSHGCCSASSNWQRTSVRRGFAWVSRTPNPPMERGAAKGLSLG